MNKTRVSNIGIIMHTLVWKFKDDDQIKEFDIYYNTSLDFTNVLTLNGPTVGIHETNNTLDTLYYEFDSVTVNNITIRMQSTQTPNRNYE